MNSKTIQTNVDYIIEKIHKLNSLVLYQFMDRECGCCTVGECAYQTYMHDGHGCHKQGRCINFEKILNDPNGEFMKIYRDPNTTLNEKNRVFMTLYKKHGTSGETLFYKELKETDNLDEDYALSEFHLKMTVGTLGELWENADRVVNYHFRHLKKKSSVKNENFLKYLINKCKGLLNREVWYDIDGVYQIIDNFIVIDGQYPRYKYWEDCSEYDFKDACSTANDFLTNYFDFSKL